MEEQFSLTQFIKGQAIVSLILASLLRRLVTK